MEVDSDTQLSAQGGSIVFISSFTAYVPLAPIALYAVSKTALLSLTKALAEELGHTGIRVNCIAPGMATPCRAQAENAVQGRWIEALGLIQPGFARL